MKIVGASHHKKFSPFVFSNIVGASGILTSFYRWISGWFQPSTAFGADQRISSVRILAKGGFAMTTSLFQYWRGVRSQRGTTSHKKRLAQESGLCQVVN
jgi:hypothetical protein